MKRYKFTYQYCDIEFNVDESIFTKEMAIIFLDQLKCKYDENMTIDEALKQIAIMCLKLSLSGISDMSIKTEIAKVDGYFALDGKYGIELKWMDDYVIESDDFILHITNLK